MDRTPPLLLLPLPPLLLLLLLSPQSSQHAEPDASKSSQVKSRCGGVTINGEVFEAKRVVTTSACLPETYAVPFPATIEHYDLFCTFLCLSFCSSSFHDLSYERHGSVVLL